MARALGRVLVDTIQQRPSVVLGLPTGRTPIALYDELVRVTGEEAVDWRDVRTFNLDEFVGLGADDSGSYRRFMDERLFQRVNMRPEHVEFLDGNAPDLAAECDRYEQAIADAGGIDIMILGIGHNGHIGFNEPAETLVARTHRVTLDDPSRAANAVWFGGNLDAVPREALTMGMGTILRSRTIVLIATGEMKADVVRAMMYGGLTTRLPASFLQVHPRVSVMLDESLADQLS